ncbi:hypothetical protein SEA_VINE_7 [Gordonia phage Vine]|uniref:MuF-like minor capsid protein n=1 Tax=Gordonia phage Vine TaxID=2857501 RepID=A0AAE7XBI7_9CAUD|nr:head maturation protease [Gordonia phage Vine]QZD97716.1 hypothetical protein SEA_VINE_7 [Gordonia phage Vine]
MEAGTSALQKVWRNPPITDDERFFDYMQDAYEDIATPTLTLAAEAGSTYYELAGGVGHPADIVADEALRVTARWAMSKGDQYTGLELLAGSLEGHSYSAAQDSVQLSAENEPGASWARRARRNACGFCKMLATRRDAYASSSTALIREDGHKYHDRCRCLAVAVRPGQVYRPPSYVDQWEKEYQEITKEVGTNPDKIVAAWNLKASA